GGFTLPPATPAGTMDERGREALRRPLLLREASPRRAHDPAGGDPAPPPRRGDQLFSGGVLVHWGRGDKVIQSQWPPPVPGRRGCAKIAEPNVERMEMSRV